VDFIYFIFYLDVQISTGGIHSLDGLVGAVVLDGKSFITSANADYIPLPPFGDRHVRLRADSRYGDDDPTQWAQPYIAFHCHLAAVPRPNTLLDHQIIWWTPTIGDVSCPPNSGPVSGLWKLSQPRYNELRTAVIFLTDRVTKYQQSSALARLAPLQPPMKWINQVLDQLHSVLMSLRHIEFVVRDLQRIWLHVWAILDYMEIYKPRIDGIASPVEGVADTIGTFTTSIRVAQDMFLAGLPCWLIRESATFSEQKIYRIAEILHPRDYIVLGPHKFDYPIIFKGPAASFEKFTVIETFGRNFLRSRDPFAMTSTPSQPEASTSSTLATPAVASSSASQHSTGRNSRGASTSSTPATPAVASSSATQPSTRRNSRGVTRRPGRGRGAGKSFAFGISMLFY
jgi:hypothetical protein